MSAFLLFYYWSLKRLVRWGTIEDAATSLLHSSLFSAFCRVSFRSRPVHSRMLSSHRFFCLPLFLPPGTVPCSMVLDRPDERVTCPYHLSSRCLTIARRSVYGPISLINRSHFTYSHSIAKVCLEENSSVYLRIFRCAQSHILLCSYIENLSLHFEGQVLETAVVHPFGNSSKLAEQVLVNLVNKHRYVDFLCYRFSRAFCSISIAFGRSIF